MTTQDFIIFFPEILLVLFALFCIISASFWKNKAPSLSSQGFKISFVAALFFYGWPLETSVDIALFSNMFIQNSYTIFLKTFMLLMALGIYTAIEPYLENDHCHKPEFASLMAFSTVGYMLMISSQNFVSLFISTELASFSTYLLVAFNRENPLTSEAALKYFILGALSTAFFLFGISFIYGISGTISFNVLAPFLSTYQELNLYLSMGLILILVAFAFKTSLAPFHMWTPDVYEGSPTPVTAYLIALPKIAAIGIFLRLMIELFNGQKELWQPILGGLSLLSMIVGSFTALFQKNIKRIIAYSTIAHMGYAALGLMAGDFQGSTSLLNYVCIYVIATLGVFTCLLLLRRQGKSLEMLDDFKGLGVQSPGIAATLMVFLFSLAGIPPLAGFFAKLSIFAAALERGFVTLVIVGVLTSVVAAGFYLKIIRIMYFDAAYKNQTETFIRLDRGTQKPTIFFMIVALIFNVFYIVQPQLLSDASYKAVKSVFIKV